VAWNRPRRRRSAVSGLAALAAAVLLPAQGHAEWKPVERVEPYSISGTTGPDLYASIGERGPRIGIARVIAHTNFKLTWTRKYERQGDACVLAAAKPKLIVTYTLPEPAQKLSAEWRQRWQRFIDGVRVHERVHGDHIEEMTREIEAFTVGLRVDGDPKCVKIKTVMAERLSKLSLEQRQRSRDFDKTEMSDGGNIHRLILDLVNGR
jgi:predicted secreted Zn-dependent protease